MWPFRKSPFLPSYEVEWHFATYAWLLENFGGYEQFKQSPLILPNNDFFPEKELSGEVEVPEIFNRVKLLAGLADWPTNLEEQDNQPDFLEVQPGVVVVADEQSPGGTFQLNDKAGSPATISYNPSMKSQPIQTVATFAHELGHYLTSAAQAAPPGGWEAWEIATDLTAVFFGFGIFNANSAFHFSQFGDGFTQGWSSQRLGYLSENSLLFGLAIFIELTGTDVELAKAHLKLNLQERFILAVEQAKQHHAELSSLRKVVSRQEKSVGV